MQIVTSIIAESTSDWHPRPLPRSAMLAVVPGDGRTIGQLARVDPDKVYALAERAPSPELRAAARRVRGHLIGGRHV